MADNEIIKALKCCWRNANHIQCTSDCPLYEYCESDEENEMDICGLALDLINRQKLEIERLNSEIEEANRIEKENELEALEEFAKELSEKTLTQKEEYIRVMEENHPAGSKLWEFWHGKKPKRSRH